MVTLAVKAKDYLLDSNFRNSLNEQVHTLTMSSIGALLTKGKIGFGQVKVRGRMRVP